MSFDILAPVYRWMELLLAGRKLHRCRCAFLEEVPTPQHVLMLGEGHGRFLVECLKKFPNTHVTYLDASTGMIEQAMKRCDAIG
ncbi:class I SAM-dependent methyltransferase [Verrucomicrobium spinosum]|uniref:class I SAM-dependent methyltransferase n=1 Tax=Verrucomicrobium spinosum TaxID=2736 RepID=UPI000946385E|nr:class I SAM-dependent methyltransferase [Verrucomicrobium spinosum]